MACRVACARSVADLVPEEIETRGAYERVGSYRRMPAAFPYAGGEYGPHYGAARPAAPCRWIAAPGTPFALYHGVDEETETVGVFAVEHQRNDPPGRFSG